MEFFIGGAAAVGAGFFTNPLEVLKTRMQLQGELRAKGQHAVYYKNVLHAGYIVAKNDGILALQKGLVPALWVQLVLNGMRLVTSLPGQEFVTKIRNSSTRLYKMEFVIGGIAATSAGLFTNPLEVVKHHMELSQKSQMNKCRAFFHTGLQVAKHDGVKSLQKGLSPALGAYLVSYGMKLGTYQMGQSRGLTTNSGGDVAVPKSVLTSGAGGLLGQYLSNPFYLLKYQHEMDVMQHNANNSDKKSTGYMDTIQRIYRDNGIRGFFRGATASLPRAFIGTSQLTSFALAKESLNKLETFQNNPFFATVLAGVVAGIVLSMAMTPFDLVLTKMYKQAIGAKSSHQYSGYLDCIRKIYGKNGLRPFYRGMGPLYIKLGPHTVLCLVFWEELKGIYANHTERTNNDRNYSTVPTHSFYQQIFSIKEETPINYFNESMEESSSNIYWC